MSTKSDHVTGIIATGSRESRPIFGDMASSLKFLDVPSRDIFRARCYIRSQDSAMVNFVNVKSTPCRREDKGNICMLKSSIFLTMHNVNALFLHISLVLAYCGTITAAESKGSGRLFDLQLTKDMKGSDADVKTSALSKLIKFVVKGKDKSGEYLSIESKGKEVELGIQIKDSSIFCPGDKADNCQNGFRRTDVLPAVDGSKTFVGTTVFHQYAYSLCFRRG
ncbi:uncharacterized protein MELLADRAFT_103992 [Melampsora larici-populina 98AG31]|uniref:Glycoside hydrolase 131 catalytic N-terminal domain-containing protein n=1 Tax=Melampsora larici-populina (strain 98AG31 / pathotype 3-4-7) TaxID=747676 RepID=F4RD73_MELLP|nr:uncharacterized protein MELLADRAFT_103992 [Melampsora larici-populina 98AG31]EGG09349.1 hypothetical protein MELLADRAFT_103992 [Melampsora larici-populina 98AG31]